MNIEVLSKSSHKLIGVVIFATAVSAGIAFYGMSDGMSKNGLLKQSETPVVENLPVITKVAALGRLEPQGEIINLSAPLKLDGDRVMKILVQEGEKVKVGDIVAVLDSQKSLQDEVQKAKEKVRIAQSKLAQVRAGAKSGQIQAQKANIARLKAEKVTQIQAQEANIARLKVEQDTEVSAQKANIARLQAEVNNANAEYHRYAKLFGEGAISTSSRDSKRLTLETTKQQLQEAKANLNRIQSSRKQQLQEAKANLNRIQSSGNEQVKEANATLNQIKEVRPVDIQTAKAEVDNAIAAFKQAKTNLEQANIKSPIDGQVLKIHTQEGEKIEAEGIVKLGNTQQMMVVAEVYQTDIEKVKVGQKATITGQAFSGKLEGEVSQVGLQVNRQDVFSNQPGENLDRRVIDVKIRLNPDDSQRTSGLTNLQVQTEIKL